MNRLWKLSLFVILVVGIVGYTFQQPIFSSLLEYSLKGYFHYIRNAEFNVERIHNEGKGWIIEKPSLTILSPHPTQITAERASMSWPDYSKPITINLEKGIIHSTDTGTGEIQCKGNWDGVLELSLGLVNWDVSSEFLIQNLNITNSSLEFDAAIPKARVVWNKNKLIELLEPISCYIGHAGKIRWQIEKGTGNFHWPSGELAKLIFHGECTHLGKVFPISFIGRSNSNLDSLQEMKLECSYGGMNGNIDIDWKNSKENISVLFSGNGFQFIDLFPESLRRRLQGNIGESKIILQAMHSLTREGNSIDGVISLHEGDANNSDTITFGLQFSENQMKKGWFQAKKLSLKKYISPLIFENEQMQLLGHANVEAVFDKNSLVLCYESENIQLTSQYFEIFCEKPSPGSHYLDFKTGCHGGYLPLQNAEYLEKNCALVFANINAQAILGQKNIRVVDIESISEGAYFLGNVDVDFSDRNDIAVEILLDAINGNCAQIQAVLEHLTPKKNISQLPITGNISLNPQGGKIQFSIKPESIQTHTRIQGKMSDGALNLPNSNVSLHDISTQFSFDSDNEILAFTDIQGRLITTSDIPEEYSIAGDHIRFLDEKTEFDLWVGDKNRDIIRIVGEAKPLSNGLEVSLDNQLSHFGDMHPDIFRLALKDTFQVDSLDIQFKFQLATLLKDIQRLNRTGLIPLSEYFSKELNQLKGGEGDFNVKIHYDSQNALLNYHVTSQNCLLGQYAFQECILEGRKKAGSWTIDQLKLDNLSFAADLTIHDKLWTLNFVGMRFGNSLLAGMEGEYFPFENKLKAKINLLEMNLDHLHEIPFLKNHASELMLQGICRAHGNVTAEWGQGKRGLEIETSLNASLKDCAFKNWQFKDCYNFSVHYISHQSIAISNLKSSLKIANATNYQLDFDLNQIAYNFQNHQWQVNDLKLYAPTNQQKTTSENVWKISQLQMNNFSGNLFDTSSYRSEGVFSFQNAQSTEKDVVKKVWNLPFDTLSKTGLDLSVLYPVSGTVEFQIDNKKLFFTKFKDVYSKGQLARFDLLKNRSQPSYIDFEGNLFVELRIKQTSLLHKLAELLTLTVQGNVLDPKTEISVSDE